VDDHEVGVTSQSSSLTWGGTDREPRPALGVPGEPGCGEVLLPSQVTELAVGPGAQGAQFLAEAAQRVRLVPSGLDP